MDLELLHQACRNIVAASHHAEAAIRGIQEQADGCISFMFDGSRHAPVHLHVQVNIPAGGLQ